MNAPLISKLTYFLFYQENTLSKLKQILELPNVRAKDALRLVALFTIRYSKEVEKNLDLICGSVQGKGSFINANPVIRVHRSWDKVFNVLRP